MPFTVAGEGALTELVAPWMTVTVNGDPARQLFTFYLAIVVTQGFTKEAARVIWGLDKILCPKLAVRYAADQVR